MAKSNNPQTRIDLEALALELHTLLGLPKEIRKRPNGDLYYAPTKGYEIIHAVIDTVKAALQRGESVSVRGLGTFKIRERPAHTIRKHIVASVPGGRRIVQADKPRLSKPKLYVQFKPAASLEAWINLQGGFKLNNRQLRATQWWK